MYLDRAPWRHAVRIECCVYSSQQGASSAPLAAPPASTPVKDSVPVKKSRIYDDLLAVEDIGKRTYGAWTSRAYDTTKRRMKRLGHSGDKIDEVAKEAYAAAAEVWNAACS